MNSSIAAPRNGAHQTAGASRTCASSASAWVTGSGNQRPVMWGSTPFRGQRSCVAEPSEPGLSPDQRHGVHVPALDARTFVAGRSTRFRDVAVRVLVSLAFDPKALLVVRWTVLGGLPLGALTRLLYHGPCWSRLLVLRGLIRASAKPRRSRSPLHHPDGY
jgi:hypothetical protein